MSSIDAAVRVAEAGEHDVRSVIANLAPEMRESYVLMETSRSRHGASLERPRLVAFGTDARFLFAVASAENDPRREVIEMAELDAATGLWRLRDLDMSQSPARPSADDSACRACHGSPPRPIWGTYREWLGAFGGGPDNDSLTAPQVDVLRRLRDTQTASDRFFGLVLPEPDLLDQRSFILPARRYGYANTVFNFELGARVAEGLFTRISTHAAYPTARWGVLAGGWCSDVAAREQALSSLGLDLANDMDLAHPVGEAHPTTDWNQGSTYLGDILAFLVLDEAVHTDAEIAKVVAPIEAKRGHLLHVWWQLRGEERRAYLRDRFDLEQDDLRPQELVDDVREDLCAALATRTGGR